MNNTSDNIAYHPFKLILYFALLGISSMFLILTIAYFVAAMSNDFSPLNLPAIFHLNTIIILLCSYAIHRAYLAAKVKSPVNYEKWIVATLMLGIIFVISQIIGWTIMFDEGIRFENNLSGSYIYAISGIHALHVIAGLVPLIITIIRIGKRKKDPVRSVIFDTDPVSILKVRLMATYWHFVDILWIYLYVFFLVNVFFL